jgi:hypothetical protein
VDAVQVLNFEVVESNYDFFCFVSLNSLAQV